MRFPFKFSRRVGGSDPIPVLGTDSAPTGSASLAGTNVFKEKLPAGAPVKRVALGYAYTGAGVPLALTAKVYLYDGTSEAWFTTDANAVTLKPGDLTFVSVPQRIGKPQVTGGDAYASTSSSLEVALVVSAAGGDPDGTYSFLMGLDLGDVEDETAAPALPTGAATSANQDITNTALASIAETTHVVAVTATTYDPPLRWIHNYGSAGICKIKSSADDTAQTIYLAQGQMFSCAQIVAVSDIGAGVTMTGGR